MIRWIFFLATSVITFRASSDLYVTGKKYIEEYQKAMAKEAGEAELKEV